MSDNENGENGDELVTKPFKFVTGMFLHDSAYMESIANVSLHSWYATLRLSRRFFRMRNEHKELWICDTGC
jgi:hypothetical protein